MRSRVVCGLGVIVLSLAAFPAPLQAQHQLHPRWEIPGFDFRPNGAWRVKSRRVAETRRQLLASGDFSALNGPLAQAMRGAIVSSATSVAATHSVPALIFSYKDIDLQFMRPPAEYQQVLFGVTPTDGKPYTVRSFYDEMSNGLLTLQGQVLGWVQLDSNEVFYAGTPGTCAGNPFRTLNCNGIFSVAAVRSMQNGMRAALARVDTGVGGVNFGQFDNDGPDGIPNSSDDDGYVDMIMFAHATRDGACGGSTNNHIWSHRFVFVNASQTDFQDYATNDVSNSAASAHPTVLISDYFMTSGLGGPTTGCDSTQIMAIGTAAHEFGHALGLPDLYDTGGPTEGIGQWGLMGSGNFTSAISPSRMEAWSLNELGWVFVRPLTTTGTYNLGAAPVSDTAFFVNVQGANSRNESFLIENRQASQADTAVIRIHCSRSGQSSPPCGGGLLIWHLDGAKIASFDPVNTTTATHPFFGLKLMQADGLNELNDPNATPQQGRRGDAGDPYPGVNVNTAFSYRTNPAARKNVDNSFIGFAVDSIRQVVPGGEMAFRLRFGALTVVRASDTTALVQVDGTNFSVFRDLLEEGQSYTLNVPNPQVSADGRTRFSFVSWSNDSAISHTITGSLAGGTLTANLSRQFKLIAAATSGGTVAADTNVNLTAGDFIPSGRTVTLTATVTSAPGFCQWTGDTTAVGTSLALPMGRPYTVLANFGSPAAITTAPALPAGVMGATYDQTLQISGGSGTMTWSITSGALPSGLTLNAATGQITGFPRQTGNFSFQASVTSCGTASQTFTLSVTAPTLATADVVTQLLGPGTPLNADQVRYLDFLGNSNSFLDIGDFLAWVKATGAPLSAAVMSAVLEKGGRP